MKLLNIKKASEAILEMQQIFADFLMPVEDIDIEECGGRVLGKDLQSPISLPEFHKSTVDGYAVKASNTTGASDSLPTFLRMVGEVEMGMEPSFRINPGECGYIPTGGMLPEGADGVVMIEYTEKLDEESIGIMTSIPVGEGIIRLGDDVLKGTPILKAGTLLSHREISILAGCGIYEVPVRRKPRIAILSTGDEIVGKGQPVTPGKVRDINSFALSALVKESGGEVTEVLCLEDQFSRLREEVLRVSEFADIILLSGGSSAGKKDETANVIESLGAPGVFVHGVAVKPGKPTIIGSANGKAYFGLPGHPGSAMIIYQVFVKPLINRMLKKIEKEYTVRGNVTENIPGAPGKETFVLVKLEKNPAAPTGYYAIPLYGKSAAVAFMAEADGFLRIGENVEGLRKGDGAEVVLFHS